MNNYNLKYLLALLEIPGIGCSLGKKLWDNYPDLSLLFSASVNILQAQGLTEEMISYIKKPNWQAIDKVLQWGDEPNHYIIDFQNPLYPKLLKEISRFPLILFINGNAEVLNLPQLAIVGSRNPTSVGYENAFYFAKELVLHGLTITSGLALGIDGASHKGALASKGFTVAVLGTGIDQIYPRRHLSLAEEIIACGGALVSEFPFGTGVKAQHFPQRNRLISGMSLGTLVVEANLQSGSLITARFALEQNREVFAIPGSIHNPLSRGSNHIIQSGAKLVATAEDVLTELNIIVKKINCTIIKKTNRENNKNFINAHKIENLDLGYKKLLDCIGYEVTSIDVVVARSGLSAREIAAILVVLELEGYIKSAAGGYIKT